MAQINLRKMTKELHSDAKIAAIQCGMTLEQFVMAAIREKIDRENGGSNNDNNGSRTDTAPRKG